MVAVYGCTPVGEQLQEERMTREGGHRSEEKAISGKNLYLIHIDGGEFMLSLDPFHTLRQ